MRYHASSSGPHSAGSHPGRVYRGSPKRVRRIRFRGNWAIEVWVLVAVILFTLFVVVPWLVRHPSSDHPHVEAIIQ
jgi:hypothetical protein